MAKSLQKKHWLVHVLRRAGIVGAEDLGIDPGAPPAEAWSEACEATGISLDELAAHVADYFRLQVANLDTAEMLVTADYKVRSSAWGGGGSLPRSAFPAAAGSRGR